MGIKISLKYSLEALKKPIFAEVIRSTSAQVNILYASMDATRGEILAHVEAPPLEIDRIIQLFKERGVDAKKLERVAELDRDICMDCGACISLCPTEALHFTREYSVELNEEKCVACEACVPACPVKAIKVTKA
ncbi:MAG: hypothetical protein APU95_02605 [Hadesarchaea archaeon YNP_N21]|jgi:ferredoxin|nr:MAG: hypothetical protein APU95_02605 [Hadesarchaea archaeon YNP_N21]